MKKAEKIKALELVNRFDIKVKKLWFLPFNNIHWELIGSKEILTKDQYRFLTTKKLIKPKEIIKDCEEIILTITSLGKFQLSFLKGLNSDANLNEVENDI